MKNDYALFIAFLMVLAVILSMTWIASMATLEQNQVEPNTEAIYMTDRMDLDDVYEKYKGNEVKCMVASGAPGIQISCIGEN